MMPSVAVERPSLRSLAGTLRQTLLAGALLAANCAWAGPTVTYVATNLADTTIGEDLWRYDYVISGPLEAFGSLNILFGYASYMNLLSTPGDPGNFSSLDIQPDTGLATDGIVILTPFSDLLASDSTGLSVDFVWTGNPAAAPGSQTFQVFDAAGNFSSESTTRAAGSIPVPEPAVASLVGAALLALGVSRRRRA